MDSVLTLHPETPGSILGVSEIFLLRLLRQRPDNVDWTHLIQAIGNLDLDKLSQSCTTKKLESCCFVISVIRVAVKSHATHNLFIFKDQILLQEFGATILLTLGGLGIGANVALMIVILLSRPLRK